MLKKLNGVLNTGIKGKTDTELSQQDYFNQKWFSLQDVIDFLPLEEQLYSLRFHKVLEGLMNGQLTFRVIYRITMCSHVVTVERKITSLLNSPANSLFIIVGRKWTQASRGVFYQNCVSMKHRGHEPGLSACPTVRITRAWHRTRPDPPQL